MSKKVKKKKKVKKQALTHRKNWSKYPSFTYPQKNSEIGHVPKSFIQKVKNAVRALDFNDGELFDDEARELLKDLKEADWLNADFESEDPIDFVEATRCICIIGDFICKHIDQSRGYSFLPYQKFEIFATLNNSGVGIFGIFFDALLSMHPPGGTMYYSIDMPKVKIKGTEYKVSFSRHAIDRIFDRTLFSRDYTGLINTSHYLSSEVKYEFVELPGNQLGLSVFEDCLPDSFSEEYPKQMLGIESIESGQYKYRLGYFPVTIVKGFVKAITMLTPGMRGTPEYELFANTDFSNKNREIIQSSVDKPIKDIDSNMYLDITAPKWFHDNGIPQVVSK